MATVRTARPKLTDHGEPAGNAGGLRVPSGAGIVFAYVLLVIAARLAYHGFFAGHNLLNLLTQNVGLGLTALGVAFVVIAGNFDLSVGAIYGLAGVLAARLADPDPVALALAVGLLGGLVCGLINSVVISRFRVNSFIGTLATGFVITGISLAFAKTGTVVASKESFISVGTAKLGGVPVSIIVLAVAFAIGAVLLARTRFGQGVYAVGGNAEAARLAGIPVRRVVMFTFLISGVLTAVGGVITASQIGVGQADVGNSLPLDALAVVVVGGISITGGQGAIWRAALGLLIIATMNNLFAGLAWSENAQEVAKGGVILIALAADRLQHTRGGWRQSLRDLRERLSDSEPDRTPSPSA
jgi:ribose transport system permease protein